MKAVIQRVREASVSIGSNVKSTIGIGLLVLLGIEENDLTEDADWLLQKIVQLRIFPDEKGLMNLSIKQIDGELLLVSQFTLFASTKKGNRPSFTAAAKPEKAIPLYQYFTEKMVLALEKNIGTGEFGADMKIALVNDGPVTIIIDSKNKE